MAFLDNIEPRPVRETVSDSEFIERSQKIADKFGFSVGDDGTFMVSDEDTSFTETVRY